MAALATALVVALSLLGAPVSAAPGRISAEWPAATVERGARVAVTGVATGLDADATVQLQQRVLGGWRTVKQRPLDSEGGFRVRIPTWWVGERSYRVAASEPGSTALRATTAEWAVRVTPAYRPPGAADQHKYSLSSPTRWNPCQVIGYRVNARQARRGWKKDVRKAFNKVARATGYRFAYRGRSSRVPQSGTNDWFPRDTDIVIAWAKPSQSSLLRKYPGAAGVGAALSTSGWFNGDGSSTYRIKRGMVVIDSRMRRPGGFGKGVTRGDVLLHEIGHTLGLTHVPSDRQIMHAYLTRRKAQLGKGDLRGMEKRGAGLGCLTQTPPTSARGRRLAPGADRLFTSD
ncbi:matrixin family metalloprotease [Nocardioides donggukensis]|uniref:Matrixin family metalloprotease n=1 Tax=Nocardioides donggukensis TaxID=2774019 RepID=A0A927K4R4_9ACTN|nr:matrixin family metalloprotease [Nocardioides donggukensis]MBD8870702.1 matrixin family metalloprotease [Nocardioides donggukensis]